MPRVIDVHPSRTSSLRTSKKRGRVDNGCAQVLIAGDYCPFWFPQIAFHRKIKLIYRVLANPTLSSRMITTLAKTHPQNWKSALTGIARSLFPLTGLEDLFEQAHLSSINLECVLCNQGQPVPGKRYHLAVQGDHVCSLIKNNIKHVALANNHILDLGPRAAKETLALLRASGIAYSGIAHGPGDKRQEEHRASVKGIKIGILAYLDPTKVDPVPDVFFSDFPRPFTLCPEEIIRDVKAARAKVDLLLVHLHWGREWSHIVESDQRRLARRLIEEGVSVVVGHHPHVVQDYEEYRGGLIFYSLGNLFMLLSGIMYTRCRFALMPLLRLTRDGIDSYRVITTEMDGEDRPVPAAAPVTFDSWSSRCDGGKGELSNGIPFRLSERLQDCRIEGDSTLHCDLLQAEFSTSLHRIPYSRAYRSPAGSLVAASREFYENDLRHGVTCYMKTKGVLRIVTILNSAGRLYGYLAVPNWFREHRPMPSACVTVTAASRPGVSWNSSAQSAIIDLLLTGASSTLLIEITNPQDQEIAIGLELLLLPGACPDLRCPEQIAIRR